MSDRGRGGRGGGRGGVRGNAPGRGGNAPQEKPKKEAILNLAKYVDQKIRVKFSGGREGYDQLMNLVMDDVEELLHNPANGETTGERRSLGLAILRGTNLTLINPVDGFEMIEKCVKLSMLTGSPFSQTE